MATSWNKTAKLTVKRQTPGTAPLRAKHHIARPAQLDKAKVDEVVSVSRGLGLFDGRRVVDSDLIDVLFTPSPLRFQLLCHALQFIDNELEAELEEVKPAGKKTVEEARFEHVVEFCQDVGLFDDGDELDLLKVKGEISDSEQLKFWRRVLRSAHLMKQPGRGVPTVEELIKSAEDLTEAVQIFADLDVTTDAASLLHGPLLEEVEANKADGKPESFTTKELEKMVTQFDAQLRQLQNQISEMEEEDAENSFEYEEPPEELLDETSLTKIKLLRGLWKDLINTFLAMYDASIKHAVASGNSVPVPPNAELENAILSVDQHQSSLSQFVSDIRRALQHLTSLDVIVQGLQPAASDMASEHEMALSLNLRNCPPKKTYYPNFDELLGI